MDEIEVFIEQLKSDNLNTRRIAAEFLGQSGDPRSIKALINALGDPAWQVRNACVESLIFIQEKWSIQPLVDLLKNEDVSVRNSAMTALSHMGNEVAEPLSKLLDDEVEDTRIFAANTLGNLGSRKAVEPLIKKLDDEDPNVQYAVIEALGKIGDSKASIPLIKTLEKVEEWDAYPIIAALAQIADPLILDTLIDYLDHPILCGPAIEGLGNIGDISAVNPLIDKLLPSDDDEEIGMISAALYKIHQKINHFAKIENNFDDNNIVKKKLKDIKSKNFSIFIENTLETGKNEYKELLINIIPWLNIDFDVEKLIYLLKDQDYYYQTVSCLRNLGLKAVPFLLKQADNENEFIRAGCAESLIIDIGFEDEVLKTLLKLSDDNIPMVQTAALNSLGIIGNISSVPEIKKHLTHEDYEIRDAAVGALSIIGTREVIDIMVEFLNAEESSLKTLSLKTLGIIDDKSVIETAAQFTKDENPEIRSAAIQALGNLARGTGYSEEIAEEYQYTIYDEDPQVRETAITALGKIYGKKAVELFYNLLDDEDDWVIYSAIQAIGKYGDSFSVPEMTKLLKEPDLPYNIQIAVCETLGQLGDASVKNYLKEFTNSEEPEVVSTAITALGKLKIKDAQEIYLENLQSEDWDIAMSCIEAIENTNLRKGETELLNLLHAKKFDHEDKKLLNNSIISALGKLKCTNAADDISNYLCETDYQTSAFKALIVLLKEDPSQGEKIITKSHPIIRKLFAGLIGCGEIDELAHSASELLKDKIAMVRRSAAQALGKLKNKAFIKQLEEAEKNDKDSFVRKYAGKALKKLNGIKE